MSVPSISSPELTLHDWACLRTELIWIYNREVLPTNRLRFSDPGPGNKAWLIRQGQVRITNNSGKSLFAGKDQWLFLPREQVRHHFSEDARIFSIHFLTQWPSGDNLFSSREGHVINSVRYPDLEKKAIHLERLIRRHQPDSITHYATQFSDYANFLEFQSLFLSWLAEWFRVSLSLGARIAGQSPGDNRVLQAVRCLNEAPLEKAFPKEWLEKETQLGEAHLNRLFLQSINLTTRKYWERRRFEFAKSCLGSSSMPIKEIAYRLGFRSDSHFVIWFRRLGGASPGSYRRQAS